MLRDTWEGMVIRDIATAGGVDPGQVRSSFGGLGTSVERGMVTSACSTARLGHRNYLCDRET